MSEAPVAAWPTACSGERYWAVPMTMPVAVIGTWLAARETPKSVIFTVPERSMRMFPGLTSRCTTPDRWAACSARAVCARIGRSRAGGSTGSRSSRSAMGSPTTSSMTRYPEPLVSP
ncbi:Uncharacterised protein [Mycobacteroides abscessus]|nr:Uncharacterised protein [Mycobacteroides abscessus]